VIMSEFFKLRSHGQALWVRVSLNLSLLAAGFALRFAILALVRG
jgi:hypothetical protein